jgi:HK97 family phage major capsid protein
MSTFLEIKGAIDRMGEAFEAYKETNDQRLKAVEKGNGSEAKELGVKLERIEADVTKFSQLKTQLEREHDFQRERIEALEARASNPKKTAADVLNDEYKDAFIGWMRSKGQNANLEQKMQELSRKAATEHKAITIGTPSAGGYAVPEEIAREIERMELLFSPVRRLVKVVQVGTSDYKELVSLRGASSGWVGESGSRTATDTPTLREVVPTNGELYAYPQVSEWSLDDIFFNVEQWLAEEVAQELAYQEGSAFISGNGSNKPTGLLNTTPVLTDDFASPMRAAAAFQYIASDSDPAEGSPAVPNVTADALIDTVYALNSAYRSGAQWVMNSATTGAVRKLKTADGVYHWQPGLAAGQPNMLLGYPVETWEQMPDIGLNNFPVGFGNWRRAYVLADRVGMRITRDNVTSIGHVKFYIRRREGGIVLNNDSAKFIRTIS